MFVKFPDIYLLRVAVVALLYFASAKLALMLALPPTNASPVWLPAGVALTSALLFGWQIWPAILFGYLFGNLDVSSDLTIDKLSVTLAIAVGAVLQALLARWLIRRATGFPTALDSGKSTLLFFLLGGPVACTVSSGVSHLVFLSQNIMTFEEVKLSWLTWWIGDSIGVVLLTPLLLILMGKQGTVWARRRLTLALPLIAVASIAIMTFYFSNERDLQRIQASLNEQIGDIHHELQKSFDETHLLLESIANYAHSTPDLNASAFEQFVTPYLEQYEWVKTVAWVPREKRGNISLIVNNKPVTRAVYGYPIQHVVPSSHAPLISQDLESTAAFGDAIEFANNSGMVATSKALTAPSSNTKQLALLHPVYISDSFDLRGFAYIHLDPSILISDILGPIANSELVTRVQYEEGLKLIRFFDNQKSLADPGFPITGHEVALHLGNQILLLDISPTNHYLAGNRHGFAWLILLTLLIFAAMMCGFLLVLTGRNSMISDLVKKRTYALSTANQLLKDEIEQKKLAQAQLESIAHFDPLTGLANRTMFKNALSRAMARSHRNNSAFAVLYMDLDRFKSVNDTFGHSGGDMLLQGVGQRLIHCVREEDIVARLGGDEFVVIAENIHKNADIAALAKKIIDSLSKPLEINGRPYTTSTSIGIAICPDNGNDEETLLMHADTAMYRAKKSGSGNYRFYTSNMQAEALDKLQFESDLRSAFRDGQFTLNFQPICHFSDNTLQSVEALLRWNHPERGSISPETFIPIAEEIGLINELGNWVLDEACSVAKMLEPYQVHVAVNVSTIQLDNEYFIDEVLHALDKHLVSPSQLELELTESIMMKNADTITQQLQPLRDQGVKISVDDFGTGYSSLSYLKSLPIDSLKIDQSFVFDIKQSHNSNAIIRAILALAHELELTVVAEGVETELQAEILRAAGCDLAQGYLLGRPMDEQSLITFFDKQTISAVASQH